MSHLVTLLSCNTELLGASSSSAQLPDGFNIFFKKKKTQRNEDRNISLDFQAKFTKGILQSFYSKVLEVEAFCAGI